MPGYPFDTPSSFKKDMSVYWRVYTSRHTIDWITYNPYEIQVWMKYNTSSDLLIDDIDKEEGTLTYTRQEFLSTFNGR